ncbi:hypothetical protein ACBY01_15710 [Sphingomonas sp. ac-8]|uniref:hypothetical protein n=1 Tax=Sphingomonas sp. ac-8 TaxID=3242977 RepID=UPI003A7FA99F
MSRWGCTDAIAAAPLLYTDAPTSAPGVACTLVTLTELAPMGPVEIARFRTFRSNGGTVRLAGRIVAAEKDRSFTLSYPGTQTFDEIYVRAGDGGYRPVAGSRVSAC